MFESELLARVSQIESLLANLIRDVAQISPPDMQRDLQEAANRIETENAEFWERVAAAIEYTRPLRSVNGRIVSA